MVDVTENYRGWLRARPTGHGKLWTAVIGIGAACAGLVLASVIGDTAASVRAPTPTRHHVAVPSASAVPRSGARGITVSTVPAPTPAVGQASPSTTPTSAPATPPPPPQPPVVQLVDQAVAAGITPGPGWSWAMADDGTSPCGAVTNAGTSTGCTSWASGVIRTVFTGSPALPLVAHEVANAETEADAVPGLLSQVATTEAGTSWSPTDAVASCLVVHFLGFQDNAAGAWQCPPSLADYVALHIHDTVTTTKTTAVCGATSKLVSTLTFTAASGTLAVTGPAAGALPQTVVAGTPVTVSGVGTFTAVDTGGTSTVTGACAA